MQKHQMYNLATFSLSNMFTKRGIKECILCRIFFFLCTKFTCTSCCMRNLYEKKNLNAAKIICKVAIEERSKDDYTISSLHWYENVCVLEY